MTIATILIFIQLLLLTITGMAVLYIAVFAFAGLFYYEKKSTTAVLQRKIAVLIPGYKEDEVIVDVAKQALKQSYAHANYDVIVIADSFEEETIRQLKNLEIKLIEVSFDKSTKSKALNRAMSQLPDVYDVAVVLDADNVMEYDFLEKINLAFEKDIIAVQGHRAAKNLNNGLAVLDAASEEINNHIFRKGHRVLGLSSAIIGSGMAFKYNYFKTMMSGVNAIGGFDKEIELKMLSEGLTIEYLNDAWVYDEKIQKADAFTNQRRRWLSAQFYYFKKDIFKAISQLVAKGNVDYFDKAIQFIQPPRILLVGATGLQFIIFAAVNYFLALDIRYTLAWLIVTVLCMMALLISVPRVLYSMKTLRALTELPKGMLLMLGSLLKIKGKKKQFLHTKNGANDK